MKNKKILKRWLAATVSGVMLCMVGGMLPLTDGIQLSELISAKAAASKSDAFLDTGTNAEHISVFKESDSKNFSMNGELYSQGLVFDNTYADAPITFDVKAINNLSFSIGHVDNADGKNAVLRFYLDDKEYASVSLYWTMPLMEYELDVSKASSLRILLDRDGYSSYAIGNLSVDGEKIAAPSVPTYESTDDFLHRGFALYQTSFGNTTAKEPSYNMNGRGFFDGIMFKNTYEDAQVCYNVENVKSMSFTIGHIDNSDTKNAVLRIYLDNKEFDTVDLYWTMPLQKYELDVSKASVLRIYLDRDGYSGYALSDFTVDNYPQEKDHTIPTYESTDDFLHRGFALYQTSFGNLDAKDPTFSISGTGYYEGILFKNTYEDARICYNVENVQSLSFIIGHVDGTDTKNAALHFYLDNKELDTINLSSDMAPTEYTLDVSSANVLRIYLDRDGYSSYALANPVATFRSATSTTKIGDINADGTTDVADLIVLQKWILNIPKTTMKDANAADLNTDGVVDVFDLALLKRMLIKK